MSIHLHHNEWGQLVYTDDAGVAHVDVEPVRAFPITDPAHSIAILNRKGEELAWIADLTELPAAERQFLEEELSRRHFLPVVMRIHAVEGITDPTTWDVDTDRGRTTFQLRSEEDIRRLPSGRVVLVDSHGIRYLIPDYRKLDAASRRLLER
jgi:hypothetical protein